jgi:hypothetical protein
VQTTRFAVVVVMVVVVVVMMVVLVVGVVWCRRGEMFLWLLLLLLLLHRYRVLDRQEVLDGLHQVAVAALQNQLQYSAALEGIQAFQDLHWAQTARPVRCRLGMLSSFVACNV